MRGTKRTPEVEARIFDMVRNGASFKDAAEAAGIHEDTLHLWRRKYTDFSDAITRADAECAALMAATIVKAAPGDWRAAESWLKRRRRDEWSERTELTGKDGTGLEIVVKWVDGAV